MVPDITRAIKPPTSADFRHYATRKILLVDPNPGDLAHYRSLLLGQGYEVRACASYTEGHLLLEKGRFDLIIVNQGSRNFEGRFLLARAIEIDRRMPVLVLTECLDIGCYLEAMQLGAVDYVEKPLGVDEVVRLARAHIRLDDQRARAVGVA